MVGHLAAHPYVVWETQQAIRFESNIANLLAAPGVLLSPWRR